MKGGNKVNKVVLIGRLTKDPELKFTANKGTATARFNLAVPKRYKKEGGPDADFIPVVAWGKTAENIVNYQKKGRLISVSGRIETRSYEHEGSRKYVTEVVADEVSFLEWADKKSVEGQATGEVPLDYFGEQGMIPVDDEDAPF